MPESRFNLQAPPIAPRGPVERQIAALGPWFHNVSLPGGEQTAPNHPLGDFPRFKWEQIRDHIPQDLSGRTVLDIGCNAGFYSFELARRGAEVFGIDSDEHYLAQARWLAGQLGLEGRTRLQRLSLWDLLKEQPSLPAAADLVLFMGVLYHLRYPLLGLDIAASRAADLVVFQTLTTPEPQSVQPPPDLPLEARDQLTRPGWPRMSFVERSFAGDPTNWWVPNSPCCEGMLRAAGLYVLARPGHEIYVCRRTDQASPPELAGLR